MKQNALLRKKKQNASLKRKEKNSFTHKAMNNIKGFFKKMIEPEDE